MFPLTSHVVPTLAVFGLPGGWEWIIILGFGLLLFGRRLPEVGRSLGQGIVEFKKGLKGVTDDVATESSRPERSPQQLADRHTTEAMQDIDAKRAEVKR